MHFSLVIFVCLATMYVVPGRIRFWPRRLQTVYVQLDGMRGKFTGNLQETIRWMPRCMSLHPLHRSPIQQCNHHAESTRCGARSNRNMRERVSLLERVFTCTHNVVQWSKCIFRPPRHLVSQQQGSFLRPAPYAAFLASGAEKGGQLGGA